MTDGWVGVGVETIEARTEVTGALGLLCRAGVRNYYETLRGRIIKLTELQSVATVNIEVMITGLSLPGERVED